MYVQIGATIVANALPDGLDGDDDITIFQALKELV
jgi:hypothetical protein